MKKQILLRRVFFILLALAFCFSASYAYFYFNFTGDETNVITPGCLRITLIEGKNYVLENIVPTEDEQGKKLTPYTYTITNDCTIDAHYETTLNVLKNSGFNNENKVKVYLSGDTLIEPVILNTFEEVVLDDRPEDVRTSYKIDDGYLAVGDTKTFYLRMWIDYNATSFNNPFESKIIVTAIQSGNNEI